MAATVISFVNSKGGAAKTTSAVNVATHLRNLKKKVLLIDMDPQADASFMMGLRPGDVEAAHIGHAMLNPDDFKKVLYTVPFVKKDGNKKFKREIDVCPSHNQLNDVSLQVMGHVAREQKLKRGIAAIKDDYDYIIIDCPPAEGVCTLNALAASDYYIIHVSDLHAQKNIEPTQYMVADVKMINENLKLLGIVFTRFTKKAVSKVIVDQVTEEFKKEVFKTRIRERAELSDVVTMPICSYKSSCDGNKDYAALAAELHKRVKKLEK